MSFTPPSVYSKALVYGGYGTFSTAHWCVSNLFSPVCIQTAAVCVRDLYLTPTDMLVISVNINALSFGKKDHRKPRMRYVENMV